MSVTEARAGLPEVLDRVAGGDEVTITRHGRPVAVVVRPDALRVRRAEAALAVAFSLRTELEAAARRPLPPQGSIDPARAEELIAEVRAGRDGR